MTGTVFTSAASHSRLKQGSAWLDARDPGEELVIVGASLPAANELARNLAHVKGAAFSWHRSTLARLAAEIAAPALKEGGLVPITRLGSEALIARLVQQKTLDGTLGRYVRHQHL
jgi:ATP-dependent helicase/nuclease subunit B